MLRVIALIIAYLIMIAFLIIERSLRKDAASKTLEGSHHDQGTTRLIGIAFAVAWTLLLVSLLLNYLNVGMLKPSLVFNIVGTILMIAGISLRITAARTLGRFYTRTLRTAEDQNVVSTGIYKRIRHLGYLGDIILFIGAGLCVSNWIILVLISFSIVFAYLRRIHVEEQMLSKEMGTPYAAYMKRSRRLIPFVY